MKLGKVKSGVNRDRAYWEPPGSGLHLQGHIEEISVDAPPPTPQSARRQRIQSVVRNRTARAVTGLAVVVVVLAASLSGALAPSHGRQTPAPSASLPSGAPGASGSAFATPTAPASPAPTSTTTLPPIIVVPRSSDSPAPIPAGPFECAGDGEPGMKATGWPVTLCSYSGQALVGLDGTLYVDEYEPISTSGRAKPAWLEQGDGSYAPPVAFGLDGTIYAVLGDASAEEAPLSAFDSKGKLKAGWPVDLPGGSTILAGPSGTVYVLSPADTQPSIRILGPDGAIRSKWTAPVDGSICGQAIRPDGILFLAAGPDDGSDCSIRVYSTKGQLLSGTTPREWNGLAMAPDGTVVAWGYDLQPYSSSQIARTRVAILGTDALPLAGWPLTFEGKTSEPAFGPDGTVYLTQLGLGTSPSRIVAIDHAGATKPGWPFSLPAGYGPLEGAESVVIGDQGAVYAPAVDKRGMGYVLGLDSLGVALPGWPYKLPEPFAMTEAQAPGAEAFYQGPLFARPASGPGLLYLPLEGRIVALKGDGSIAPGWPYVVPAADVDAAWEFVAATPDGGLVVIETVQDEDNLGIWLIRRWTPAGKSPA